MSDAYLTARNRIQRWYGAMHAGGHRQFFDDLVGFEAAIRDTTAREYQSRLEAYQEAVEIVEVLIAAVPTGYMVGSDHPAAVTLRAVRDRLRELSGQPEAQQETR